MCKEQEISIDLFVLGIIIKKKYLGELDRVFFLVLYFHSCVNYLAWYKAVIWDEYGSYFSGENIVH